MKNSALPRADIIAKAIERLSGRAPDQWEIEQFKGQISLHELTDPLAITTFEVGAREYRAKGNRVTSCLGLKEDALVYFKEDGTLGDRSEHNLADWLEAFTALGWVSEEGVTGMCETRHPEQSHVKMKVLTSFDRTDLPQPILMSFPCITPDGKPGNLTVRTFSLCEGISSAQRILDAVLHARSVMPGGPESASKAAIKSIQDLIAEIQKDLKNKISLQVTAPDWRYVLVTIDGMDNLLEAQEENVVLSMEQCRESGVRPEHADREKLKTALKQQDARLSRSQRGGVAYSGLARTILQDKDPRKQTKWRSSFSGGLTTRTRLLLRNGNVGAEAIVEKEGKRIFRLLNNTFEIPDRTIPEGIATAMIGKPLSDLVEHPFVTDQMIITKLSSTTRRIEGRYKDEARTTA